MKIKFEHEIDTEESFEILLKNLCMEIVLEEDENYIIHKNRDGENGIYIVKDGCEILFDYRGDLFIALRNVAVMLYPNLLFRNADYIYNNE